MVSKIEILKPVNRHLLIVPHIQNNETNSGVLLPDDYNPAQAQYIEATVIDIAGDCHEQFRHLRYGNIDNNKVVVDRSMIQEVKLKDKTHHMILYHIIPKT